MLGVERRRVLTAVPLSLALAPRTNLQGGNIANQREREKDDRIGGLDDAPFDGQLFA